MRACTHMRGSHGHTHGVSASVALQGYSFEWDGKHPLEVSLYRSQQQSPHRASRASLASAPTSQLLTATPTQRSDPRTALPSSMLLGTASLRYLLASTPCTQPIATLMTLTRLLLWLLCFP